VKMPFGKFKGCYLEEIPDDYLDWLRFEIDLREPLRSAVCREYLTRENGFSVTETSGTLDADKVKKIYRNLARQYHPDIIGGTGDVMTGINLFYEAIKQ
jgi:hypothetical protein